MNYPLEIGMREMSKTKCTQEGGECQFGTRIVDEGGHRETGPTFPPSAFVTHLSLFWRVLPEFCR
jgi:hypothetical protein